MASPKAIAALNTLPLRNLKRDLPEGESSLRKCSDAGRVVARALDRAGIPRKDAAMTMGISDSLLTRQLNNTEHLSWQRLNLLPDVFKRELLASLAEDMDDSGIQVVTQISIRRRA